jgi:hypothetical protein
MARCEVRRIPSPDVERVGGMLRSTTLGIAAPVGSAEALEFGLATEQITLRIGNRALVLPPWFTSSARPVPGGLLRAIGTTIAHVGAGLSAGIAAGVAGVLAGGAGGRLALTGLSTVLLVVLASVVVHEVGHVVAYRLTRGPAAPAVLVVRGFGTHLVRLAGPAWSDTLVAASGALGPIAVAALLWTLVGVAPFLVLVSTLVAAGHATALLLPFGDGATLRAIARGR